MSSSRRQWDLVGVVLRTVQGVVSTNREANRWYPDLPNHHGCCNAHALVEGNIGNSKDGEGGIY
jgi:hypothetical protein